MTYCILVSNRWVWRAAYELYPLQAPLALYQSAQTCQQSQAPCTNGRPSRGVCPVGVIKRRSPSGQDRMCHGSPVASHMARSRDDSRLVASGCEWTMPTTFRPGRLARLGREESRLERPARKAGSRLGAAASPMYSGSRSYMDGIKLSASRELDVH